MFESWRQGAVNFSSSPTVAFSWNFSLPLSFCRSICLLGFPELQWPYLMPQSILCVQWYLYRPVLLICSTWKHYIRRHGAWLCCTFFLKFLLRSVRTDAQRIQPQREKDFDSALALKLFYCCHNCAKIMETGYVFSYADKNALSLHLWDQLVILKHILHSFRTRLTVFYNFCSAYICLAQPFTRLFPVQ